MVQPVCISDAVNGGVDREGEDEDVGHIANTGLRQYANSLNSRLNDFDTHRLVARGIMCPALIISTSKMYGKTERRLW